VLLIDLIAGHFDTARIYAELELLRPGSEYVRLLNELKEWQKATASPDYSQMLEKHRNTVSSLRGEPLLAALNGPLPCRPPPIRSNGAYSSRPGLNESLTFL
jgi:hypothetical protein